MADAGSDRGPLREWRVAGAILQRPGSQLIAGFTLLCESKRLLGFRDLRAKFKVGFYSMVSVCIFDGSAVCPVYSFNA